jgi:hypothetical protein
MKDQLLKAICNVQGATTAEYAVATAAACSMGGVLYKLITSPSVQALLADLVRFGLKIVF